MSSPKNYVLNIDPAIGDEDDIAGHNLLRFTVVDSRVDFIIENRTVLVVALLSILLAYVYTIRDVFHITFSGEELYSFNGFGTIKVGDIFVLLLLKSLLVVVLLKQQPQDSVCIMKDIGIQLISQKSWKFQNTSKTFVPLNNIIDLVIHEGLHGYGQVIFYLCILTKADKSNQQNAIEVIFPEFLPRKDILIKVRKLSRDLLFGDSRRYFRRIPGQGLRQIHHH